MATFFDITLLENFSLIFTFLLVFAIIYALLEMFKLLGDNKGIHAIVAISVALIMLISKNALQVINLAIPWFVILFVIAIFALIGYKLFNPGDISEVLKGNRTLTIWVVVIAAVIFIGALSQVYGQTIGPYLGGENTTESVSDGTGSTATGEFSQNLTATFFHPKVLGLIIIMLIAVFTVFFLARGMEA